MIVDALPPPALQAPAPTQAESPAAPQTTGFRPIALRPSAAGHFHASGTLNGQPVEIIIDTGASATVVDRTWADAQKLPLVPLSQTAGGVGGAALTAARVDNAQLSVGGVALPGAAVVAIDLGSVIGQLRAAGVTPPQVVIGTNVLKRWRAVIDYATNTLWLAPTPA
ncbi:MAG: retroviral-like aspartic protease family protein [Sphingomonas sp.]|uniref:retropepsin-like aspartic protease family protein n=1 Tax=Sphingomonas sp. TaxID=28214 RepID=UPI0025FE7F5E|nr:retropepsin-like aspartic protease [Sphingomonas sp.]MBX9880693.1 retroviral-like aspartic protease family protein [Sphingomonas sp.]